jgi:hypothetical protein
MRRPALALILLLILFPASSYGVLDLGPGTYVEAGGQPIQVYGYSVPSFVCWDGDDLPDLIVGEGSGLYPDAMVRVYLNTGTPGNPVFGDFFYAQTDSGTLVVHGSGCLGIFPRVVRWNGDGRKDLLVGLSDGTVRIYLNTNMDDDPVFDTGTTLKVGPPGEKVNIDVGLRATPCVVDWNGDGVKDLVVGALDGYLHVFINEGSQWDPDFRTEILAQDENGDLAVPTGRASPIVRDLDGDGLEDLRTGNTEGQLIFYRNIGTAEAPLCCCPEYETSDGIPIDLPGYPRSRPFLCDWNEDGFADVLIGCVEGMVHLYLGAAVPAGLESPAPWETRLRIFPSPARGPVAFLLDGGVGGAGGSHHL